MQKPPNSPIGIIGAMPQEVNTLTKQLSKAQTVSIADMTVTEGELHGTPVVVMQCGIGKVNAAIGTALLLARYPLQAVINTGSAGGIDAGLAVGDVVIGDTVTHHDVDITAFGYAPGQMAQMPKNYPGDARLIAAAKQAATTVPNANIHCGQIVSGHRANLLSLCRALCGHSRHFRFSGRGSLGIIR